MPGRANKLSGVIFMELASILEAVMVVSFGISWPMNILKSVRSRTAKGKSLFFLCMILFGYFCGILSKISSGNITYVTVFYILNLLMVSVDIALYIRNRRLDILAAAGTEKSAPQ